MSAPVLLAYSNRADAATLEAGSWSSTLPRANLQNANVSKYARTSDATLASTRFRFDLGANYTLRALALANHNLSTAATWRLRLGTAVVDFDMGIATLDERLVPSGSGYIFYGGFSATHSATAGTIYAEFDTPASGTRPIVSLDDNTANEQIRLYSSGTDLKFTVTDGGVTQCDITIGTIAASTTYKVAVAWSANDFAGCLSGGTVATDASGTLPTVDRMRLELDQAGNTQGGAQGRICRWNSRLSNAQLQSITTSGPDVLGYNTGFINAKLMTFQGDTPSDWGARYNVLDAFDALTARYGTVEIVDTANTAGYVQIGRLFVGGGFQPTKGATRPSWRDGRMELSSAVKSLAGKKYGVERRRPRMADFALGWLSLTEAELVHEMQDEVGVLDEVMLVPDPDDLAHAQRYGGLGLLRELSEIEYPHPLTRAVPFRWEEKL